MSDFRCEWQALHGPRCSHQCNECKDNDTPPEPRMTSERQETENRDEFGYSESDIVKHHGNPVWEAIWSTIKRWDISRKNDGLYSSATGTDVQVIFDAVAAALRATPRAVPDETREAVVESIRKDILDAADDSMIAVAKVDDAGFEYTCQLCSVADLRLLLVHPPRAGSASKERGFFEWSCGCSLNNGLVTPCATHASPAAAPREHPSPEPYCASCDAREGEPCPHNVIQCARPRRAHPPRAGEEETREAVAFTASAGTCRRCGSRVRMGGPAPDSCTNCAAPAESHPPRAGEVTEDQEMMNAFVREIDHYRNLLADAYVTIGCAVASEDGLDGSEADAFHAKVRRLWPAAVDHPTVARWLALPEEGDTDILGRPS